MGWRFDPLGWGNFVMQGAASSPSTPSPDPSPDPSPKPDPDPNPSPNPNPNPNPTPPPAVNNFSAYLIANPTYNYNSCPQNTSTQLGLNWSFVGNSTPSGFESSTVYFTCPVSGTWTFTINLYLAANRNGVQGKYNITAQLYINNTPYPNVCTLNLTAGTQVVPYFEWSQNWGKIGIFHHGAAMLLVGGQGSGSCQWNGSVK